MDKNSLSAKKPMSGEDFVELMQQIEASGTSQVTYARKQYLMSQITAAASIVILGVVLYVSAALLPKVNATFETLGIIMGDLQVITAELAVSDLDDMISNVNNLVTSNQDHVQDALTKINAIDIGSLNKAIKDLSDVIAPLAKFVNLFQ